MSPNTPAKKRLALSRRKSTLPTGQAPQRAFTTPSEPAPPFPIVAVGASAGGLEAFGQLLSSLPVDTGMGFVLIQHLDPQHTSLLPQALSRSTTMPVVQITDGMVVEPNHVYVIPPNADAGILHGSLTLLPRSTDPHRPHLPVDFFFRALAADLGSHAIGIVMSGTASDGTAGLKAIKTEDGITLVQDPESAKFAGMPQSAIDAGVVDAAMSPAELAAEVARLARHPYFAHVLPRVVGKKDDETLKKIFVVVRNAVGVDYSEYKPATLERRLDRRMAVRGVGTRESYLKLLLADPGEARLLYEDVLIHVTSFFRDPDVFEQIKKDVFPTIVANKAADAPIRLWVAGCSTGEEVYSLAIALLEFLDDAPRARPIQIFGTDISEVAIEAARTGVYSDAALRTVSDERRRRFFIKVDRGYRISKTVRELCIFVRHDLARDPPFSKLDLVSCRNVLIYFGASLQKRIIATFHYCLNHPGFLLLGRTESISGFSEFFTRTDRGGKTFARTSRRSTLSFVARRAALTAADKLHVGPSGGSPPAPTADLAKYVDRLLLAKYAPAGVVVNDKLDIVQFRGKTGAYLEPAAGTPQLNLFKMVREGLLAPSRLAFDQAKKTKTLVRRKNVLVSTDGTSHLCDIAVAPLVGLPAAHESLFLVLFERSDERQPARSAARGRKGKRRSGRPVAELETELASTRDYLEALVEEHARTNDDLAASNEEFVSSNEELQSMNEELETAKEELQSSNEELTTVNDELHSRNQEVSETNADLVNLLNTVEIPVVMLDAERRIKRFTPSARAVLNVQPTDVGRPIDEIRPNVGGVDLEQQIAAVVASGGASESEVQDCKGHWYRMQVRPSQNADAKVDGAILSLIDIDALKQHVADAEWARDYALDIVEAVQVPLVVLDEHLSVLSANEAYYGTFETAEAATRGQNLFDLDGGQWNIAELRIPLEQMLSTKLWLADLEVEHEFPRIGRRIVRISACVVHSRSNVPMILLALEDITARKQVDDERAELLVRAQAARKEAEHANAAKDDFLAMLSHELRTPLAALLLQSQLLRRGAPDTTKVHRIGDVIERNTRVQIQLIDDLLDVSRIVTGKLTITPEELDLAIVVQGAIENVSALAQTKEVRFSAAVEAGTARVSADPVRMLQVVSNLLTNAVKFSQKGGHVAISLTTVDGDASVCVRDEGRGIAPEFLPHVFDRFTQQDSSTTRLFGGLGLGLAIVRHIVDLHGGTVRAESAGADKGATFWVTLPLAAGARVAAKSAAVATPRSSDEAAPSGNGAGRPLRGMRVLVVDDDAANCETTSEILSLLGASAVTAPSALEALRELSKGRFDVVLCDIAMPEQDGYSFIRRLRRLDADHGGGTPAIAYTALAGDQNRARSLQAGFQMHLSKPIDIERLAESVRKVTDTRLEVN